MKNLTLSAIGLCLTACSTLSGSSTIRRFDALEAAVGHEVILDGRWSSHFEACGLFLGTIDIDQRPAHCVQTDPVLELENRQHAVIAGTLERSRCGTDLICLNVCGDYVMRNARVLR